MEAKGRPAVPDSTVAVTVGSTHGSMTRSTDAVAPQAAVAVTWTVPAVDGVPEMMLPASARPAGRPLAVMVEPGVAVMVERNGSPAVPPKELAVRVGAAQAATAIEAVAVEPQEVCTVIVPVPAPVGVPETMLPASVRPAGRLAAVMVVPGGAVMVERNATPTVPVLTLALTAGAGQGSHDDSASTCIAYL